MPVHPMFAVVVNAAPNGAFGIFDADRDALKVDLFHFAALTFGASN
jgi:hypothetical protein